MNPILLALALTFAASAPIRTASAQEGTARSDPSRVLPVPEAVSPVQRRLFVEPPPPLPAKLLATS